MPPREWSMAKSQFAVLRMMRPTRRQFAETEDAQLADQSLVADRDGELIEYPPRQIDRDCQDFVRSGAVCSSWS